MAYLVDIAAATVSDWKLGHCTTNPFLTREACCASSTSASEPATSCPNFETWSNEYAASFGVYVAFALAFGLISAGVTMLTKSALPSATTPEHEDEKAVAGKTMYMAAGSGIPEIKTILGGFVIPDFLSLKVLVVKAVGAVFAVSTGMCLGKEGESIRHCSYEWIELMQTPIRAIRPHLHLCGLPRRQFLPQIPRQWTQDERDAERSLCSWSVRGFRCTHRRCFVQLRGDQHLLPKESPVEGFPLQRCCCHGVEGTQSHRYWKTGAFRDQLWHELSCGALLGLCRAW